MRKLSKLTPILLTGVLFLSGCGLLEKEIAFEKQMLEKAKDALSRDVGSSELSDTTQENTPSNGNNSTTIDSSKSSNPDSTKVSEPRKNIESSNKPVPVKPPATTDILEGDPNAPKVINAVNEYIRDLYVYDYKDYSVVKDKELLKKWGFPENEDCFNSTLINVDYDTKEVVFPYYNQVSTIEGQINLIKAIKVNTRYDVLLEFVTRNQCDGTFEDASYIFDDYSRHMGVISLDIDRPEISPDDWLNSSLFLDRKPELGEKVLDSQELKKVIEACEKELLPIGIKSPTLISYVVEEEGNTAIAWLSYTEVGVEKFDCLFLEKKNGSWSVY